MSDAWSMLFAERADFADFLESLTPEQWETQTLCTEWKVRDAAAHVILGFTESKFGFFTSFVKNGFNFDKSMSRDAKAFGARAPEVLVKELREHAEDRSLPPAVKPPNLLNDTVVHHQDCRRPLDMARAIPEDRLRVALDASKAVQPILGNKKRISGLKLIATDMEWSTGDGPEVTGTGEALLMAMHGRVAALDDLGGDGLATLRSRVSPTG